MNNGPLKRVSYFQGQILTAEDLSAEQEYFREKNRRHNRNLHGAGVVSGLEVSGRKGVLTVQPGVGINCRGEEICLLEPVELPFPAAGEEAYLLLSYAEKMRDPVPAPGEGEGTQFSRVEESFRLAWEPHNPCSKHGWKRSRLEPCGGAHGIPLAKLFFRRGRWRIDRRFRPPRIQPR